MVLAHSSCGYKFSNLWLTIVASSVSPRAAAKKAQRVALDGRRV